MRKILSQYDWNNLPLNTYARLTFPGPEGERHSYVTRVVTETGPAEGEHLSLGGAAWRDAFNDATAAYALRIPDPSRAMPAEVTQPLDEFKARDLEIMRTRDEDAELPELHEKAWLYVQRTAHHSVASLQESLADHDRRAQALPSVRSMLDDALYVSGHSDTHPAIHGSEKVIQAADLSGRHLGMTVRSIWYRDNRPGTAASPEESFPLLSINFLRNGNVHVNDSFIHLRPETEVTLIIPPAA